ncbi:MAG TPA: hypothetical protein VKY54_00840 [Kiloniellales bacterium]|jgi:hypothetical protein|nr:hypothetical protein [Kiloniellales bacterium]
MSDTSGRHDETGKNKEKKKDDALDEAIDESFPASDPPSQTVPPKHRQEKDKP